MTRSEWWDFATHGTRTGKVGVTRKDGQALVSPVWFLLHAADGHDELLFTTHSSGAKSRILARDPRLSVLVDDQEPPYSYVQFQGVARLDTDPDEMLAWASRLGARYMGEQAAEAYGRRNAVEGEFLVRVRITRVLAVAGIAE